MTRRNGIQVAPYDSLGNLEHYPSRTWNRVELRWDDCAEWRPNLPFESVLYWDGYSRGMSAAYGRWKDPRGHVYPMFMIDLSEVIASRTLTQGSVHGRWIVAKRGKNYGLRLAKEDE